MEGDLWEILRKLREDVDILKGEPTEKKGVWFVFGYDGNPYPVFVSDTELEALRYMAKYNFYHVKFWEFGTEWNNDSRTPSPPTGSD